MALNVNVLSIVIESPIVTPTQSLRIDLKIVINDGTYVLPGRGRDQPSSALIHEYFEPGPYPFDAGTSYEMQKLLKHEKVMRDSDPPTMPFILCTRVQCRSLTQSAGPCASHGYEASPCDCLRLGI